VPALFNFSHLAQVCFSRIAQEDAAAAAFRAHENGNDIKKKSEKTQDILVDVQMHSTNFAQHKHEIQLPRMQHTFNDESIHDGCISCCLL